MATDSQLVERARKGDREAFGDLVDRYRDMVYGLGYHLTGDFEAARDLAQEAFVQAFTKLGQLRHPHKFAAWLRRIAASVHRDGLRRKQIATVTLEEGAHAADRDRRPSETELAVRAALAALRASDRLALTLHYINGYTHAEIGAFLGIRSETAKTRLARARQRLRGEMTQMVENVFKDNALPSDFRKDVIAAVNGMVADIRSAAPEGLPEIAHTVHRRRNQAWRSILARLPAPYGPPLKEQGEAPQIPIADLPEDLQQAIRDAMCYTWLDSALSLVHEAEPWIPDINALWIGFGERKKRPYVVLSNCRGDQLGYTLTMGISPEDAEADLSADAGSYDAGRVLEVCALSRELRQTIQSLHRALPDASETLRRALSAEFARIMREVRKQLPENLRGRADPDKRLPVRDLPESIRTSVRKAVYMRWAAVILGVLASPPFFLTHFEQSSIEFGLYSPTPPSTYAGLEYVKLRGPDETRDVLQTGIAEALDEPHPE
ncbi:MAG: sigma-70 family RNA polymerase sigma factor [Armatimonadota bacterium]|nr:MAG: sigma-70 family RNA polymerase sigma factor [Armatimonadota bacterium]